MFNQIQKNIDIFISRARLSSADSHLGGDDYSSDQLQFHLIRDQSAKFENHHVRRMEGGH